MTILDKIIKHKKQEVLQNKELYPERLLEKSIFFKRSPISLRKALIESDAYGIIAEFKRKSPSKGVINDNVLIEHVTTGYIDSGATALSVLTDHEFFGGSNKDFTEARKFNDCPMLRKDFTIDPYQVIEAKSIGADVILLIAAVLDKKKIEEIAKFAKSHSLEVLLEIHAEDELTKINEYIDIVGVNNRNLKTFKVDVDLSKRLADKIPDVMVKISESGINNPTTVKELSQYGYQGFLIGENFMKSEDPEIACMEFIEELSQDE